MACCVPGYCVRRAEPVHDCFDSRTITVGNARRHECAAALYAFSVGLGFVFADPGLRQRANQPAGCPTRDGH